MKLILLGVILILLVLIFYKEIFSKEGFSPNKLSETSPLTGFNDDYKISKDPIYEESGLIDTLLSTFSLGVNKPEVKEDIKGGSLMIYEEEDVQPLTHTENTAIIDPEAADLEAVRSQEVDATLTEAGAKYAAADKNLKNNFLSVSDKDPIYKVAGFAINEATTKDNVMNACAGFNWGTETGTANGGWSRVPLSEKPCVGFYSHKGSREKNEDGQYVEKWTILVSCNDNDCNTIDPALTPLQSGLDAMPSDGETVWPGYPNTDVDKVWRVKTVAEGGTVKSRGRVSLENSFEAVNSVINVEIGEELKEDEVEITETQALNKCGIRGLKTKDGNECIGVVLKDGRYRYLYKSISNYEPSETIGDIFRKLIWGTSKENIDYPPVSTETYGLFSNRSILKTSVKEEYKNYLDNDSGNLITKRGVINAKQYCNNSENCTGYYSEKTDPEQYYFLKTAIKQYKVGVDGITKIFMSKEKDDSGTNTSTGVINEDFDENIKKQEEFIKAQKVYFASLATIKQYYDGNITGENVILDGYKQGDYTLLKSTLTDCHLDMERKDANGQPINYSIFPENSTGFAKGDKLKDITDPSLGKHPKPLCIGVAVEKIATGGNKYHFMRFKSNHMDDDRSIIKEITPDDTYEQVYLHKSHYKQGAISSSTATIIMVRDTIKLEHKKVKESLYRLNTDSSVSGENQRKSNIKGGVINAKTEIKKMYDAYKELNSEILILKGKGQGDADIENLYTTQWKNVKDNIQEECEKMVVEILFYDEFSNWEVHLKKMFDDNKIISNNVLSMKDMMVNKNATKISMEAKNDEIKKIIRRMGVQQLSYQNKFNENSWNDSKVKNTIHNKFNFLNSNGSDQLKNLWIEKRKDYLKGYTYEGDTGSITVDGLYQKYVICKDRNMPVYFYNGTPPNITKFCYGLGTQDNIITNAYNNEKASPRPVPESTNVDWRCSRKTTTGRSCDDNIIDNDEYDITKPLMNTAEFLELESEKLYNTYIKKSADFESEIMVQYDYNPSEGINRSTGSLLDIGTEASVDVYGNLEYALKQCHETPGCVGISKFDNTWKAVDPPPITGAAIGSIKEGFAISDITDEDKSWGFYKIINLIREGGEKRKNDVGPVKKIWRHKRYTDGLMRLDKSYPNCREFCGQQLGLKCLGAKDKDGVEIFGDGSTDPITGCDVAASPEKMSCKCADISPSNNKTKALGNDSDFQPMSCPDVTRIAYCEDGDGNYKNWRDINAAGSNVTAVANPSCSKGMESIDLECAGDYFNFPDDAIHLRPENSNLYNTGSCLNGGSRILVKNNILNGKSAAALSNANNVKNICKEGCNKLGAQFIEVKDVAGVKKCVCTRCVNIDGNIKDKNIEYTEANITADGTFIDWQTEKKCDKIETLSHQGGGEKADGILHYFLNLANKFKDVKIYSDCKTDEQKKDEKRVANMGRWIVRTNQTTLQPVCEKFKYYAHPNYGRTVHQTVKFMVYFKVSSESVDANTDGSVGDPMDDFQVFEKLAINPNKFIAIMKIKEKNNGWEKGQFVFLENKDDDGTGSPTSNTIFTHNSKTYFYNGVVDFNNVDSGGPPSGAVELEGVWRNNILYYNKIHENNTNTTRNKYDNGNNFILDNQFICKQLGDNITTNARNMCESDHDWCQSGSTIVNKNTVLRNMGEEAKSRDINNKWTTLGEDAVNMFAQSWWKESDFSILKNACKKASEKDGGLDSILLQSFNDNDIETYELQAEKDSGKELDRIKYQNSNSFLGNTKADWEQHLKMRQSPCWPLNFTNDQRSCYSPSGGLITEMNSGETLGDTYYSNKSEKTCGPNASGPGNWEKSRVNYWKNWWWDEICKGTDQMWSESRKESDCRGSHPDTNYKSDVQTAYETERETQKYNVYCGRTGGGSMTIDKTTIFLGDISIDDSRFQNGKIFAQKWTLTSVAKIYEGQGKNYWNTTDQISGKWYLRVAGGMMSFYKNLSDATVGTDDKKINIATFGQSIPFSDSYYKTIKDDTCNQATIKGKIDKTKSYDKSPEKYYAFNITGDQSGSVTGGSASFTMDSVIFKTENETSYPTTGQYSDSGKKYFELEPSFIRNNTVLTTDEKKRMPDFVGPLSAFNNTDTNESNEYEKKVENLGSQSDFFKNALWQKNQTSDDVFWICKEGSEESCIGKLRDPNAKCDTYTLPTGYSLKSNASTTYCAGIKCDEVDKDTCLEQETTLEVGDECDVDVNCDDTLVCKRKYKLKVIHKYIKYVWFQVVDLDGVEITSDIRDYIKNGDVYLDVEDDNGEKLKFSEADRYSHPEWGGAATQVLWDKASVDVADNFTIGNLYDISE